MIIQQCHQTTDIRRNNGQEREVLLGGFPIYLAAKIMRMRAIKPTVMTLVKIMGYLQTDIILMMMMRKKMTWMKRMIWNTDQIKIQMI